MQRKIIHIDMDCFFAAVEVRENPALAGKPIAVGGNPQGRGVVATCSYEARRFGIHSAMPMATALKRCAELVVLPVNMPLYKQVSAGIQSVFRRYTPLVEPLSLDEAFLDVTQAPHHNGSATLIAEAIRADIKSEFQLTASAGVAPNKFLAKVASDWHKPDGQKVVTPNEIEMFVRSLPVEKIFGVGKVTARKMHAMGLRDCADLQRLPEAELTAHFGSFGTRLFQLCRGIDDRPVTPHRSRKSLSVEDTFASDLPDLQACIAALPPLHEELLRRLSRLPLRRPSSLFLKLRFDDFSITSVQTMQSLPEIAFYRSLLEKAWRRQRRPVRLIGLGVRLEKGDRPDQLSLDL